MKQENVNFEEIKSILKEFAVDMRRFRESQIETERVIKESQLETDRQFKETDKKFQETDKKFQETDRQFKETEKFIKETTKQIREHGKQIGGLGNKFGAFTEGMAFPSLESILRKKFGTDSFMTNLKHSKHGVHIEVDALAYSNGQKNIAIAIEVKSILKEEHIEQVLKMLSEFKKHFPQFKDFKIYGMIVAVNAQSDLIEQATTDGLLFGSISEETFKLKLPDNFQLKEF